MEKKRSIFKKIKVIILFIIFINLLVWPFYFVFFSSSRAIVKSFTGKFYNARIIFMTQKFLIGFKDTNLYKKKNDAINADKIDYNFSYISVNDIMQIDIIIEEEEEPEDSPAIINKQYLGRYKINLSGHVGYLYIWSNKNRTRAYAKVKFPNWARGVMETLKRVRIYGKRIYFTRSVQTQKELKRVGASTFFVQKFKGTFKDNGTIILGKFTNRGASQMWEAYKVK